MAGSTKLINVNLLGDDVLDLINTGTTECGNVDISGTTLVDIATHNFTLAAGDIVEFKLTGYARNNTGVSQTLAFAIRIGSVVLEVTGAVPSATATDTPILCEGTIGVVSSNQTYLRIQGYMSPDSVAGSTVSATMRTAWQQSTNDLTGLQIARIQGRGSAVGTGLLLRIAGLSIKKKLILIREGSYV